MSTQHVSEIRSIGSIVLQRLGEVVLSKSLNLRVDAFAGANAAFEKASLEVDAARRARTTAQRKLGVAVKALDTAVEALAKLELVGAGIGERRPVRCVLDGDPVGDRQDGVRAAAHRRARAVARDSRATGKLHADVARSASAVEIAADAVDAALAATTPPELAYQRALGERAPLAAAWIVALRRLKNAARVAWEDKASTYDAVFAPPDAVRVTRARRRKAKAVAPAPPVPVPLRLQ